MAKAWDNNDCKDWHVPIAPCQSDEQVAAVQGVMMQDVSYDAWHPVLSDGGCNGQAKVKGGWFEWVMILGVVLALFRGYFAGFWR